MTKESITELMDTLKSMLPPYYVQDLEARMEFFMNALLEAPFAGFWVADYTKAPQQVVDEEGLAWARVPAPKGSETSFVLARCIEHLVAGMWAGYWPAGITRVFSSECGVIGYQLAKLIYRKAVTTAARLVSPATISMLTYAGTAVGPLETAKPAEIYGELQYLRATIEARLVKMTHLYKGYAHLLRLLKAFVFDVVFGYTGGHGVDRKLYVYYDVDSYLAAKFSKWRALGVPREWIDYLYPFLKLWIQAVTRAKRELKMRKPLTRIDRYRTLLGV